MGQTRCLELILGTACLIAGLVPVVGGQGKKRFRDDPRAHALYDKMIETMRAATTLSWKSEYRWSSEGGREIGRCSYTCRLKKPNQFRLDTVRADGRKGGVLIGDGDNMWIHWPNGRPFYSTEDPKTRGLPRDKDYFRQRTPLARHSIAHETGYLGAGMSMTVLDASTFHGYTDSLQRYLDGVTSEGSVVMADSGEECDIILVSF
ncbi:MAG: outer membrane lipoprotein carrier protein LolA, partial [Planctomycetota bacterium]